MDTQNQNIIETKNVYVAYEDKLVLEDISVSIKKGEFWGILGPNGSGKTTLLKTLIGLIRPLSGTIKICGKEIKSLGAVRNNIGYVPQYAHIDINFPIQVKDVVMLGRSKQIGLGKSAGKEDKLAVQEALELVKIADLANRQIGQLSGGQLQRVLIARALALKPEIMFFDEPTAALDVSATESFYEWLHRMHSETGLTFVMVSHDVGVISQYVSSVACLNKRLVAHGIPKDVLSNESLESMYGCDTMFFQHGHVPHLVVPTNHPHHHGGDHA